MPGFQGLTQFQLDTADGIVADLGKTKLQVRGKPFGPQRIPGGIEFDDNVGKVLLDKVRQQETVMQLGAPARQLGRGVGFTPEPRDQGAQQQLLGQAHARMGRHFKGTQFQQAQTAGGAVGGVEFVDTELGAVGIARDVDQQVAQQAVDLPRRAFLIGFGHLREGDLQLVQRIVARFVHPRRLGRGADKQPGKQVGQRRVVMPVTDQAAQQIRAAQERRILGRGAAEYEVVATAGAGVAPVDHEFFRGQSGLSRLFVEKLGALYQLVPSGGRLHVDLDHTRVRRDPEVAQPRIGRWLVAFQQQRAMQFFCAGFDGGDQFQIIFHALQRRHKHVQPPFASLGAQRGAGQPIGGLVHLRHAFVVGSRLGVMVQLRVIRQLRQILVRVCGVHERILRRRYPGLRRQWQAVAKG